jgi:hypothetical protein
LAADLGEGEELPEALCVWLFLVTRIGLEDSRCKLKVIAFLREFVDSVS